VAKNVLFLSSADSVRSQMAVGFLRVLAPDAFEAASAGSRADGVDPRAVAVMAERGIDIADQRSKGLDEFMGKARFDFLITVCDRDEKGCPMFPGVGTREYWPIDDPIPRAAGDDDLAPFRDVRDYLEERVRRFLVERRYRQVVELPAPAAH
jgi:arsenate reductase